MSVQADEKIRHIVEDINRERASIKDDWERSNESFELKSKNIEKNWNRAFDIQYSRKGVDYGVQKQDIYQSLNDLQSVFLHKKTKEENYDTIAKGIYTMQHNNTSLSEDILDIFRSADSNTSNSVCKVCSHNDAIQIINRYDSLREESSKLLLAQNNLLSVEDYEKLSERLHKEWELEDRKFKKRLANLNRRVDEFNSYLETREKILDEKIRQNESWQMQHKLDEINSSIKYLQIHQR